MIYTDFKKIIESCHLNFLIGSGASKPYLDTLYNIEELLTNLSLDEEIEEEDSVILETSIKYHYFNKCIKGNLFFENNTSDNFLKTQNNYQDIIRSLHDILLKRRSNLVSKQINLFTSNMDLFLEWTTEQNHITYNDGFFGRIKPIFGTENFHNIVTKTSTHYEYQSEVPLFNIFKLHGSVNWSLEDRIRYDQSLSTLKSLTEIEIEETNLLEIQYENGEGTHTKTLNQLREELEESEIQKNDQHDRFLSEYSNLVMINPTKQKFETTTRDLTFYELLRIYSNHLERENSVLFVIGFSFQDEHIREITVRVAKSNPTLTIVIFAYNKEAKESIESLLSNASGLNNIKYIWDSSEEDPINYSLDNINMRYFGRLANQLNSSKSEEEVQVLAQRDEEE